MKISDLLALHPSLMTGSELLARQPNAQLHSQTPSPHTPPPQTSPKYHHNEQAGNTAPPTPNQSKAGQIGQTRPSLRHLSHHHSKTLKKPRFRPSYARQWDNTTHAQNTAKTPAYGANTAPFSPTPANRPHSQHTTHQARHNQGNHNQNNRTGNQKGNTNTHSLATAPHTPHQKQRANLARLPDPYSFYSRYLTIKGGGVWLLAVCPFHDDTRPSLSLNMQHGGYICHTCGAKGDRIAFYMHRFNVDFVQACKALELYD